MPLVAFTAGNSLPAASLNSVAVQVTITCTSSTRPASPPNGMQIYETDTGINRYWNGSVWRQLVLIGSVTISTPVVGTTYTGTDTFPTGWFNSTPYVICSITSTGDPRVTVTSSNETTTGVQFNVLRSGGTSTSAVVRYFAYGV